VTEPPDPGRPPADVPSATRDLIWVSREAGRPERDLVVLAEGNSSVLLSDGTFICTATGSELLGTRSEDLVRLRLAPLIECVRSGQTDRAAEAINAARDPQRGPRPSIESFMHAVCLDACGARFVLHTHPTSLVGILAAADAQRILGAGALFPDEVVLCGPAPLFVDYFPPGIELGRALQARLQEHLAEHGAPPRVIYLANHGLIALGRTAREALAISVMAAKAGTVRAAALAAGGLRPLSAEAVSDLASRTDEIRRREQLAGSSA
jgi:rhamnose utilization protein RhaD (predicted bifunctional aldolase and dehydrogenase)